MNSKILEQYKQFKKEGWKLKEEQKRYNGIIQSLTFKKSEAETKLKKLTLETECLRNRIAISQNQRQHIEETIKQNKILINEAELKAVELNRRLIVAEYILEEEEAAHTQQLSFLKHSSRT